MRARKVEVGQGRISLVRFGLLVEVLSLEVFLSNGDREGWKCVAGMEKSSFESSLSLIESRRYRGRGSPDLAQVPLITIPSSLVALVSLEASKVLEGDDESMIYIRRTDKWKDAFMPTGLGIFIISNSGTLYTWHVFYYIGSVCALINNVNIISPGCVDISAGATIF